MTMTRRILPVLLWLTAFTALPAQITLEECVRSARENYPLIVKYDLIGRLRDVSLSDVGKSWLPQVQAYAQGTVQNAVPSLPEPLSGMLAAGGLSFPGLEKWQYKVGVDVSQTVWDGGASKSQRAVQRARHNEQEAAIDVQMYAVRERVENLFFGILLLERQIGQTVAAQALLRSNLDRLNAGVAGGIARQSDADMVEAQLLATGSQIKQAQSVSQSYRRMLGLYVGRDLSGLSLVTPAAEIPADLSSARPELRLFDARMQTNEVLDAGIRNTLMPRVGLFGQFAYGYPGFDYFRSMRNRELSLNLLLGLKVSWNISAFYTRKNDAWKLRLSSDDILADRDVFLFNADVRKQEQVAHIRELQSVMEDDERIVRLRTGVRRTAESQLENGVIDATDLLTKITDETQARLTADYHEVQLIQSIFQLKYTLNR